MYIVNVHIIIILIIIIGIIIIIINSIISYFSLGSGWGCFLIPVLSVVGQVVACYSQSPTKLDY
jgi:hypothetical protein